MGNTLALYFRKKKRDLKIAWAKAKASKKVLLVYFAVRNLLYDVFHSSDLPFHIL